MPSVQLPRPIEVKLAIIGDVKCGKSCLIKRFCEKRYTAKYFPTIGVDFGIKRTSIRNKQLKVNVFDMAGDMVYYEVRNEFYDSVSGILLVFDVTRQNSFRSLGRWLQELRTEAGNHVSEIAVCVCGNKTDQFPREVTYFEASQWCARRNLPYFETSALTGHGVDEAIHTLLESIVEPNAESTWAQQNGARHWWEIPEKECADTHSNTTSSKSHSTVRSPHNTREVPSSKQKVGHTDSRQKDVNGCTQKEGNIIKRIQNAKTHYEVLGLGPQATKDEINRAYRRLAFVIHPDKNTAPGSEEAFKALTAARRALLNSGLP